MGLSNDQIKEIVKSQLHQQEIQKGISHQQRLKFHSETILDTSDFQEAYNNFTSWVGNKTPELLPHDKFMRFLQLLQPPLPTVELTESIYSRLFRVFFSQDNFSHYEFSSPELAQDWNDYRDDSFWATKGFQAMQTAIDSVWVVDFPEVQLSSRPEPFSRLINISDIIDISNNEDNDCEYVIYQMGNKIVAYDDELIRVYEEIVPDESRNYKEISDNKPRNILSTPDILDPYIEIPHGLGYTPARMFWSQRLESQNFINKESPITKELSDLDWLLFHMTSKKYMDISNSYPILMMYESDNNYEDPDITDNKDRPDEAKRPAGNKLMGPGTVGTVPVPKGVDDIDLMRNPITLISPDVKTLKWHVDEEKRLKDTIFKSVVGTDTEVRNAAAKNEMQIEASFESQKSVLLRIKHNFEIIHKFADKTMARLRYGDQFIDCKIDYGSEFFLKTVEDLHNDRKTAREAGAGEEIIANISDKILNTEYKEDHISRKRAEIIRDLNPLPEKDIEETIKIFEKGGIDKINFIIKCSLINFVRKFERENISLVEFAKDIDYAKKIDIINEKFKEYAAISSSQSEQGSGDTD